ncbi:MAG: hypothetical protein M3295_08165 [Chloroflexota bacterium]|nr:hypothetical protein [Chloroflexota bacterium]
MPRVHVIDVTNRDGVQTARITLSKFQKTMLNWYLGRLGVHQSEIGFPYTPHERNYVRANLALSAEGAMGNLVLEGWCPAQASYVEDSLAIGVRDFNVSMSTSDQMIQGKFRGRLTRDDVVRQTAEAIQTAVRGQARTVAVNAEDASKTDDGFLREFALAAKEAGAMRLRYCDTLGGDSPALIQDRIGRLAADVGLPIELHCHNDLGMAVANSIAGAQGAIAAGRDAWINTCVNGVGERAGNADLASTILAMKFGHGLAGQIELGDELDLTVLYRLGRYVARAFGMPVPLNQVAIGQNAFSHESGIHADGAIKDRHNYELYDLEVIGRDAWAPDMVDEEARRVILTGEYGGVAGLRYVYEQLGIEFESDDDARDCLMLVQYANAQNQLALTDDELRFIARYPVEVREILTVEPRALSKPAELRVPPSDAERRGIAAELEPKPMEMPADRTLQRT